MEANSELSNSLVIDFEHSLYEKAKNLVAHVINILEDFGNDKVAIEIEAVAYGPGILWFTNDNFKPSEEVGEWLVGDRDEFNREIAKLQNRGVRFNVCRNAMNAFEVNENHLLDGVKIVRSGNGYLAKKQLMGSAYIKS